MSTKLGILGEPRIGIALVWFLPAPRGEAPPPTVHVSPEEAAFFREVTGFEPTALLARLQALATAYAHDPNALRAELVRLTGGDEIAAEQIVQLIRASIATGEDSERDDEKDGAGGQVIDFARPDERNEPADEADENDEHDDEPPR